MMMYDEEEEDDDDDDDDGSAYAPVKTRRSMSGFGHIC
jgi:hypothetical protein